MKYHELNLTFENQAECQAWEEKNCADNTYKGETIMCIFHSASVHDDKVTIDRILTI